jgi:hypothetical protein
MMRAHRLTAVIAVVLFFAPPAWAQTPAVQSGRQTASPSADSMGVSLKAIRQQLKGAPLLPRAPGSGLRYDFFVDVLGKRPAIEFFKDFDLSTESAVKWGGVTHQEILNAVTPFPFRHYGMGVDLLSMIRK